MLFDAVDGPRVFATGIGTDLCAALADGLAARLDGAPPHAMARVEIWVATGRMQRRLKALFAARGPGVLPRIRPIQALGRIGDLAGAPPAAEPLALRLELAGLIGRLLDRFPDLAPRSALYDLADSLADLMGEMFEEGVTPEDIAAIDVADHALYWQRAQQILAVLARYFDDGSAVTPQARQGLVVDRLIRTWRTAPPPHPVLVAGSTGSRGATARLMRAVAGLPQGASVLPGLDRDLPPAVWRRLLEDRRDDLSGEDHPQFRLAKIADLIGVVPWEIPEWHRAGDRVRPRSRAVSLALRPAPMTDQWRSEGPLLEDLGAAFAPVVLLEAPSPQMEAASIALRLREAAEAGQRAALIAADRRLVRQVTAALDRWGIVPDDSAGQRLSQTPGGRFLRHVAGLMARPVGPEDIVAILKHPLCHSGADRAAHSRRTRDLELWMRRRASGAPSARAVADWAAERGHDPGAVRWAEWLGAHLMTAHDPGPRALDERVARHAALAEALAAGPDAAGGGALHAGRAGEDLARMMDELVAAAPLGGAMSALEYRDFFAALAEDRDTRQALRPHADILIWGTQEARVQGAALMILSGLNEGTWPSAPAADPWLNRQMRAEVGLRLPDSGIGLAAHDFQQALSAPEVWLTRAVRDDETDTVPSRWLNRLVNLLDGSGPPARETLAAMRARGAAYLAQAVAMTRPARPVPPAPRPAPCPPPAARPTQLSVTQVERLIRDPYAVYAARVLRLSPLDPLRAAPDAALRGTILHDVMHAFVASMPSDLPEEDAAIGRLMEVADRVLADRAPWPAARRLWRARIDRVARWICRTEAARRAGGLPVLLESRGAWDVPDTGVSMTARVDRIDRLADGGHAIFDYKTGRPPTEKQERAFNKQLWIEALMVEAGAFDLPSPRAVREIAYIGLGNPPAIAGRAVDRDDLAAFDAQFRRRLLHMRAAGTGFPSRRAMQGLTYAGDYDHLARHGEWTDTDPAVPIPVGRAP